jgi:hypothetical protein
MRWSATTSAGVVAFQQAVSRVGAQIHFMMTIGNVERLRELAGRAKTFHIIKSATFSSFSMPFSALARSGANVLDR